MPTQVLAQAADFWSQPRTLWLKRPATGEEVKAVYFADGQLVSSGYRDICLLLRDVQAHQAVQMDLVLLDVLCGVQGLLQANGLYVPLHTHSGYRTPATNAGLENSARQSQHTQGKAWDGSAPGVSPEILTRAGIYLRGGGVGLYTHKNFTHLDTGGLRFWKF